MGETLNFKEKYGPWALVVGASAGLGEAFAENCAKRGLNVILCARRIEKLDEVAAGLRERYGILTRQIAADISSQDCADQIIAKIRDLKIGFYIFNAAIAMGGPFIQIKEADLVKAITGNCVTPTKLTRYIAREMAKRRRGGIYLVTSLGGLGGMGNWISYSSCKAYQIIMGEGLWFEMRRYGVDAATYVVGATETPTYLETQNKTSTGISSRAETGDLTAGATLPRTPESVAAYLFTQLQDGPRLYSNPDDKLTAESMAEAPRDIFVETVSTIAAQHASGGTNALE